MTEHYPHEGDDLESQDLEQPAEPHDERYDDERYDGERYDEDQYDDEPVEETGGSHRRERRGRGLPGCLAVLVAVALLVGGLYVAATKGVEFLSDQFNSAEDFSGPGEGEIVFEVESGATVAQMGRELKADGVVASVQAFLDAAAANSQSSKIQAGFYPMLKKMRAADALEILINPKNQVKASVTIPEGLQVKQIVAILADKTDFTAKQYNKALKQADKIGLPDYAEGNPEGYLFPATYDIPPNATPVSVITQMVSRWRQAADQAGLEQAAAKLGKTPAEMMIIASLIEAEGRGDDMPKIARVIYNRLDGPGDKGGTNGLLGIDASNAYGIGVSGTTALTQEQLAVDTPYNTRIYPGLPPTPIEAPGDEAMQAAANPADGNWYYYVTVDLKTGETKFYEDYDGFLQGKAEYQAYCQTSDAC